GTGGSNFRTALSAIRAIDNTRPTHYEGFGVGPGNPADLDSKMYSPILPYPNPDAKQRLLASVALTATDTALTKPFYLCEFAHAMFNSMGSLKEYGEAIDKYPSLLGGAIWEFQDQGIWNRRNPARPILAFGGGFGEFPNDHYFIHKGVFTSDRQPKPHYPEMKHVFQWIGISAENLAGGSFRIRNKYQFVDLSGLEASYVVTKNGQPHSSGTFSVAGIGPRSEKTITIPYAGEDREPGAVYHLRLSFKLANDQLWAPKGYEVASEQFELPSAEKGATLETAATAPLRLEQTDTSIAVQGKEFRLEFNKALGTISRMVVNGNNVLQENGGPLLHLWRAPHQQDDLYADRGWEETGLKYLRWTTKSISAKQLSPASVSVTAILVGSGIHGFSVSHDVVYTISGDGTIKVQNSVAASDANLVLARMGVRLFLNKAYERFDYFGRGPFENYSDRKSGSDAGIYGSTVMQQLTPYERPMECGNHEDVYWATLSNREGAGLKIMADKTLLQVAALPYSDEELARTENRIDLPQSTSTVVAIGYKTLGVGSNSCGPTPMPEYTVKAAPANFTYLMKLVTGRGK
ncbi:glycoside hydrolase family 2 TIM barrel-domain containing protein, partial [Paraflavisolibacter sp. H34]|uniref:glycoside hydrolase family 2 TIM barrel-domain containing protein n=1 Tax=Huijunlia imazamoxiresistens TaxID=3127457 RepID=UPI0030189648